MKKILFTLLLVLGISAAADAQVRFLDSSTDAVRKEAIAQDKLVFIDLYATWCGPCKMLSPVIDGLADRYEGKVLVGKVNTDEQPELAIRFGVMSIPTVIFLKDGKEIDRKVGVMPEASYTAVLDANL